MSSSTRKKAFALFFIILTLAIPFAIIYYLSTDYYKERYQQWRKNSDESGREIRSTITADRIILKKNEKLVVGRTCLVFKGLEKKVILVDLYLLDLDPEQPYLIKLPRRDTDKDLIIGGNTFKLVSVNNQYLNLQLVHSPQTR